MAKTSLSRRGDSVLVTALLAAVEPLVKALDYNIGEGEQDAGLDLPSMKDVGLRILLGQTLQNFHNQTFGNIKTSTGSSIENVKQRLDRSEEQMAKIGDRISDVASLTNQDMNAIHWFQVNEARFHFHNDIIGALATVYERVTHETWKPYERKDTPAIKVSDEEAARLKEMLTKAMERNKAQQATQQQA